MSEPVATTSLGCWGRVGLRGVKERAARQRWPGSRTQRKRTSCDSASNYLSLSNPVEILPSVEDGRRGCATVVPGLGRRPRRAGARGGGRAEGVLRSTGGATARPARPGCPDPGGPARPAAQDHEAGQVSSNSCRASASSASVALSTCDSSSSGRGRPPSGGEATAPEREHRVDVHGLGRPAGARPASPCQGRGDQGQPARAPPRRRWHGVAVAAQAAHQVGELPWAVVHHPRRAGARAAAERPPVRRRAPATTLTPAAPEHGAGPVAGTVLQLAGAGASTTTRSSGRGPGSSSATRRHPPGAPVGAMPSASWVRSSPYSTFCAWFCSKSLRTSRCSRTQPRTGDAPGSTRPAGDPDLHCSLAARGRRGVAAVDLGAGAGPSGRRVIATSADGAPRRWPPRPGGAPASAARHWPVRRRRPAGAAWAGRGPVPERSPRSAQAGPRSRARRGRPDRRLVAGGSGTEPAGTTGTAAAGPPPPCSPAVGGFFTGALEKSQAFSKVVAGWRRSSTAPFCVRTASTALVRRTPGRRSRCPRQRQVATERVAVGRAGLLARPTGVAQEAGQLGRRVRPGHWSGRSPRPAACRYAERPALVASAG